MQSRRWTLLVSIMLVAMLALAACGPRAGGGELAANSQPQDLVVDLPAIYIDFDNDGTPSIGGQPVAQLAALAGQNLAQLKIDKQWIQYLTATNVQHIHIDNTPKGIMILVNGEPIPSLGWDGKSLSSTGTTLKMLSPAVPPILEKLLPLVTQLGIGAVIRFPVADGAQLIPLVVQGDNTAAAVAVAAQQDYLKSVGTPPQIRLTINYDANGTWQVEGMNAEEWQQSVPNFNWRQLNLPPDLIQNASAAGISTVGLNTNQDGVFISINGNTLPHITWGNGEINHVLDLAAQMGLLQMLPGGNGPQMQTMLDTVKSLLPAVQTSDVNLTVNFPH
jgi:hypothetical protein